MSFRTSFIISAFILFLYPLVGKKEQLLKLSKQYFPENYAVLKEYDESSINDIAHGSSAKEYVGDIPTVIHEGYHHYMNVYNTYSDSTIVYRMNDTLSFTVRNFRTFFSKEINSIVPDSIRKKIFRYETYVNAKEKYNVTQQFGILGLLEEAAAYYQSFHTGIALFNYHADNSGWKDTRPWMDWLGGIGSYRYSITEFELFISWYMQYAKSKYPSIYKDITSDKALKKMLIFLHAENQRLNQKYDLLRTNIMEKFSGRLTISDNFIYDVKLRTGKGLYDNEVKEMQELLARPSHQLYRSFLQ